MGDKGQDHEANGNQYAHEGGVSGAARTAPFWGWGEVEARHGRDTIIRDIGDAQNHAGKRWQVPVAEVVR